MVSVCRLVCNSGPGPLFECEVPLVLSFLRELLDAGCTPSTLKVYVAAITAFHAPVAGQSLGRNDLVVRFLKGARRLNPRHGYIPKVLSTLFRAQVISLSALTTSEDDRDGITLCPVRALRVYLERSAPFRQSEQLFRASGHEAETITMDS